MSKEHLRKTSLSAGNAKSHVGILYSSSIRKKTGGDREQRQEGQTGRRTPLVAESRQSCPTLCDPTDGSPPGSPVPGVLQARTLEWVAIAFSNVWKWKVKVKSLSRVQLLATPWTTAYQAPPSMGFSRQEHWSGVPLPSPEGPHSVQLLSCVRLPATPWIAAHQASLSITNSQSLLKLMPIESVMPSSHLILLSSPSPPAPNSSQHQGLFQWVSSSHQVTKVLEFQLQHQSFQWTPRTDLL